MDENLIQNLKSLLEPETDLTLKIKDFLTKNETDKEKISPAYTEKSVKWKKQEILEKLLPFLDEKSKRITEYIIAAIKISDIITELKNKYP